MAVCSVANQAAGNFILPALPYAKEAFENIGLSAKSFDFHHGKHHNAYVVNLNKLLETDKNFAGLDLEGLVLESEKRQTMPIFNNSAQIWNHSFFWHCIAPNPTASVRKPQGALLDKITADFGSFEKFCEEFKAAGASQFGSGWVWLVQDIDTKKLSILKTSNAQTPLTSIKLRPLLTCDVWEHAYYIDFQNRRPDFLTLFIEKLANWQFALQNFRG